MQLFLLHAPMSGDLIRGTGGLRKLRLVDPSRGKGKRGGLRVIYHWDPTRARFLLFTIYDKDEMDDLTHAQRKILVHLLERELKEGT